MADGGRIGIRRVVAFNDDFPSDPGNARIPRILTVCENLIVITIILCCPRDHNNRPLGIAYKESRGLLLCSSIPWPSSTVIFSTPSSGKINCFALRDVIHA